MKKKIQLGMNPGTAAYRLSKNVLWSLIQKTEQDKCCKCGQLMSRDTFSIEHVIPWLDSEDPVGLYFDLGNISFSHLRCNVSDARKPHKRFNSRQEKERERQKARKGTRPYDPVKRRKQYLERGT